MPEKSITSAQRSDQLLGTLLILPMIVWLLIVFLYPFINTIHLSFTDLRLVGGNSNFVWFDTYKNLLMEEDFWIAVMNSGIWTFSSVFLQIFFALLVALLLNQKFVGRNFLRTWVILPWAIPYSVIAVIARWMFSSTFGVINWLLLKLHIVTIPINFLGSLQLAMATSVLVNVWKWFPFAAITFLAVLQGIPEEMYEAARIDGCNKWHEFRYITLPTLSASLGITTLLMTFWNFNTFGLIWLLTAGGPATATTTLPILVYKKAFRSMRMSDSSALSIMMFIILLIFTAIYMKVKKQEELQ